MTPLGVYGWVYGDPVPFEKDESEKFFRNPRGPNALIWEMGNLRINVKDAPKEIERSYL